MARRRRVESPQPEPVHRDDPDDVRFRFPRGCIDCKAQQKVGSPIGEPTQPAFPLPKFWRSVRCADCSTTHSTER